MDLNATLLGEMLTFAVLVWVTMRYIWPPLIKALQERQEKIAAGLAAAKKGEHNLSLSKTYAAETLRAAKVEAAQVLAYAKEQASTMVKNGRTLAVQERETFLTQAKLDLKHEVNMAQHSLQQHTADLVISALTKILPRQIDTTAQQELVTQLINKVKQQ